MIADKNKYCPVCRKKCRAEKCVFAYAIKDKFLCSFAFGERCAKDIIPEILTGLEKRI